MFPLLAQSSNDAESVIMWCGIGLAALAFFVMRPWKGAANSEGQSKIPLAKGSTPESSLSARVRSAIARLPDVRICILSAIAFIILLMALFPPWEFRHPSGTLDSGYGFLLAKPGPPDAFKNYPERVTLSMSRLWSQIAITLILGGLVLGIDMLRRSQRGKRP